MTREEAIKVLEDGSWWGELNEWYMTANPEFKQLHDAVDVAISALRDQGNGCKKCNSSWISVKERRPEKELDELRAEDEEAIYPCLAAITYPMLKNGQKYVAKAWFNGEGFINSDCVDITYNITHWMHLPDLPKEEVQ